MIFYVFCSCTVVTTILHKETYFFWVLCFREQTLFTNNCFYTDKSLLQFCTNKSAFLSCFLCSQRTVRSFSIQVLTCLVIGRLLGLEPATSVSEAQRTNQRATLFELALFLASYTNRPSYPYRLKI